MRPQQAMGDAMEGSNPHTADRGAQQLLDAPAHFRGGLVREGNGQYSLRAGLSGRDIPGDAMNQYARLAAARTREYQQVDRFGADRFPLCFIERVENIGNIHGRILPEGSTTQRLEDPISFRHEV